MSNYTYSTDELRTRATAEIDHIIELQLLKTALNQMDDRSFKDEEINGIITFFNDLQNLQMLAKGENRMKGFIVGQYIKHYEESTHQERKDKVKYNKKVIAEEVIDGFINRMRNRWTSSIRKQFIEKFTHRGNFGKFIMLVEEVLNYGFWK